MDEGKSLNWGETPWDNLTREELLRHVQRLYCAADAARSILHSTAAMQWGAYWSQEGSGGRALQKTEQACDIAVNGFNKEDIYRCFFRYAADLLFEGLGAGWAVCPLCGQMIGKAGDGWPATGRKCSDFRNGCDGVLRLLTWEDLDPAKQTSSATP